jgi:hypothetical protein
MDKSTSDAKSVLLDPNHSHFILIDDGAKGEYGRDVRFRTKLEAEIRKSQSSTRVWLKRNSSIGSFVNSLDEEKNEFNFYDENFLEEECTNFNVPMILICVNGGFDALKQISECLKQRTPILILQVKS